MDFTHQTEKNRFVLNVNNELAIVEYEIKNEIYYLTYSEVPNSLRDQGIGKILVESTFKYLTQHNIKAVAICSYIQLIAQRNIQWKHFLS